VTPFGLFKRDHRAAVDAVEQALRLEAGRVTCQLLEMTGDPRHLFDVIAGSPPLQQLVLAGAKASPPTRTRGVHLGDPLMSQWKITERDGWVLRIHCFHRNDPDVPHNHAWAWKSLILETGYFDVGADGVGTFRAPGQIVTDDGARHHRVELFDGEPAWTLFLHGPDEREGWGFLGAVGVTIPRDQFVSVRETVHTAN
jgi:hypothetical protein